MMYCPHELAPNDEELLAHVLDDQALSEPGQHHLEHCPVCQQRLNDYRQTHERYRQQLYRLTCPTAAQLTLYCAQALSVDERLALADHLGSCSRCSDEVAEIRRELALFPLFPGPPESLLQQATREVRRVVASLVQPVQPVLRELFAHPWPRYYQADDLNLSLHLARAANNQAMLLGIFLASAEERLDLLEGSGAELYQAAGEESAASSAPGAVSRPARYTTVVDRLGHFSFAPVRPGTYTLRVLLPDRELVVEQVYIEE
ncbi:MAG TPA: carboxypeptidase-like regulatory domain-containing protein [Ktedonobacteraceae bacterium]|jgi:hypothetical protein